MSKELPTLTDIYNFSDWLKQHYSGDAREKLLIVPERGGLIRVMKVKD